MPDATDASLEQLAERLRPILLRLSRNLRRESQSLGLSALDATLLRAVDLKPGVGVSALADYEQMTRPAMSAHVARLLDAGWLARQAEPPGGDARRVGLELTPAGREALAAVRAQRNDWLARRLSALEPAELARLQAALEPLTRLAGERA